MNVTEPITSFEPKVELKLVSDAAKVRGGGDIVLAARFTDFLGGPATDTGKVRISTTRGVLHVPGTGLSGREILLDEGSFSISDAGELAVVLKPLNEWGKAVVAISCKLGESKLEVDIPKHAALVLAELLESVVYAFFVAILIRIFLFQTFWIPSGSMEPTLHEKDRIVANKMIYRFRAPARGEVVIFRVFQPGNRGHTGRLTFEEALDELEDEDPLRLGEANSGSEVLVQDYIKRVIGLPGETVEVRDGVILIDGEVLVEKYPTMRPNYQSYGPVTVPPGEVFVLGDNRANSQDSHVIGTVPIRNIEGRAEMVFWPPARMGMIPQG